MRAAMGLRGAEKGTYSDPRDLAEHFERVGVAQWETRGWQDGLRIGENRDVDLSVSPRLSPWLAKFLPEDGSMPGFRLVT